MAIDSEKYRQNYSDEGLWNVLKTSLLRNKIAKNVLVLYYVMKDTKTPAWAKALIVGALGYVICPIDAIPDFIPVVGWTDDAGAVAAVIGTVKAFIGSSHERMAEKAIDDLLS